MSTARLLQSSTQACRTLGKAIVLVVIIVVFLLAIWSRLGMFILPYLLSSSQVTLNGTVVGSEQLVVFYRGVPDGMHESIQNVLQKVDEKQLVGMLEMWPVISKHLLYELKVLRVTNTHSGCVVFDWSKTHYVAGFVALQIPECVVISHNHVGRRGLYRRQLQSNIFDTSTVFNNPRNVRCMHRLDDTGGVGRVKWQRVLQNIAMMQITRTVIDIQYFSLRDWLPFGLDNGVADPTAMLSLVLSALVDLAITTILEIPHDDIHPDVKPRVKHWLESRTSLPLLEKMLQGAGVEVRFLSKSRKAKASIFSVTNPSLTTRGRSAPRQFCEKVFQMFECENTLLETDCRRSHENNNAHHHHQQQRQVKYEMVATAPINAKVAPLNAKVEAQAQARTQGQGKGHGQAVAMEKGEVVGDSHSRQTGVAKANVMDAEAPPSKIPASACSQDFFRLQGHGLTFVQLVPDCDPHIHSSMGTAPIYENNGWYKCRNATHWITGCLRMTS